MERWSNKVGPIFEVSGSKLKSYDTPWACRCLVDEAGGGTRGSLAPPVVDRTNAVAGDIIVVLVDSRGCSAT